MFSKSSFYGMAVIFIAVILLLSLVAVSYYDSAVQETAAAKNYAADLNGTLSRYDNLGSNYRLLLLDYNSSISLLVQAVSNMNTSSLAYQNATRELATLWKDYLALGSSHNVTIAAYSADMKIDYGNGTSDWYNSTRIQPGWNMFQTTLVAFDGRVSATWYPQYQEHLVLGINGVAGNETRGWFAWEFDHGSWAELQSGADAVQVFNGTILAWTYCGYDQNYNPTCKP